MSQFFANLVPDKEAFKTLVRSFLLRGGMMLLSLILNFALQSLHLLNVSPSVVVVLGLLLGELLKQVDAAIVKSKLGSTDNATLARFLF